MEFEKYRRADGSIDLVSAYAAWRKIDNLQPAVIDFLQSVESIRPLFSRQAATIALATAHTLTEY